jgi:hypothetical protein
MTDISSKLVQYVVGELDKVTRQAITNHIGREDWTFEEVAPRCALCAYEGSLIQTLTMDGEPILSIAQAETLIEQRELSTFACVTYKYKILNEKKVSHDK